MKYKVTLNKRVYEVEVEKGEAMLLDEYDAVAPVPVAAPVAAAPAAAAPVAAAAACLALLIKIFAITRITHISNISPRNTTR